MSDEQDAVEKDQMAKFRQMMVDAEGIRSKVYRDSLGNLTVGIGHLVTPEDNLVAGQAVAPDRIEQLFQADAATALGKARGQVAQAGIASPDFIPPLASVNFQLGRHWPNSFPKAWGALSSGDYPTAAMEAGRSNWMQQTPKRVRAFQDAILALPPKPVSSTD
jgi:GH24 family phage-related lysozyme (muramidase)